MTHPKYVEGKVRNKWFLVRNDNNELCGIKPPCIHKSQNKHVQKSKPLTAAIATANQMATYIWYGVMSSAFQNFLSLQFGV